MNPNPKRKLTRKQKPQVGFFFLLLLGMIILLIIKLAFFVEMWTK